MYSSRKKSIPTPRKVNGNSKGEGAQFFKGKYGTKMEFLRGWEVQAKNLLWEGHGYFLLFSTS